jgi:hypothetical protein
MKQIHLLLKIAFVSSFLALLGACAFTRSVTDDSTKKTITFAKRTWEVKDAPYRHGPGNNIFNDNGIWVDWFGKLHLRLDRQDSVWYCAEVFTQDTLGYGRYEISIEGAFGEMDPYLVFGFFTWNPESFSQEANSEIDIEFSRWGYPLASRVLHYSVHPVSLQKLFLERFQSSNSDPKNWNGRSTHVIEWRDTSISFYSYKGPNTNVQNLLESFEYSFKNPPRSKGVNGNRSAAITVPEPGKQTQARINFWILNNNRKPLYEKAAEIIIHDFKYEAF